MSRLVPMLALAVAFPALVSSLSAQDAASQEKEQPVPKALAHEMNSLTGEKVDLAEKYKGKVLLIVNVASRCGATPQYADLEALHDEYGKEGLAVLGFPCNQFGRQEPGTSEQIAEFCRSNYDIEFDMFEKVDVNGEKAAPLFAYLTSKEAVGDEAGPVKWNFEKFLVSRDGKVVKRFRTGVEPSSDEVVQAIEAELAKK